MTRQVSVTITGSRVDVPDDASYGNMHRSLITHGNVLQSQSQQWGQVLFLLAQTRSIVQRCGMWHAQTDTHDAILRRLAHVITGCEQVRDECHALASECNKLADLVARAHSLYEDAELRNRALAHRLISTATRLYPLAASAVVGAFAVGGGVYGLAHDGSLQMGHITKATSWAQEGYIAGIAGTLTHSSPFPTSQSLADGARTLVPETARFNDVIQGNTLSVTPVPQASGVHAVHTMSEALHDLRQLGAMNAQSQHDQSYATIAISHYAREDGTSAWLVTIPGTDGHLNSPLGWEQNIELMSSSAVQRQQADSARFVAQAMRQAGIQPQDHVALIGHSQGGIIAATLAADPQQEFQIDHIVTAGSPIANHPIDHATWVTSIEMDDELVAALDGGANPTSNHWLTIRGTVSDMPTDHEPWSGVAIEDSDGAYQLSHSMKYHEAALSHATLLGSPRVQQHDLHFYNTIQGTYQGTTYWQGRMGHDLNAVVDDVRGYVDEARDELSLTP